MNLKILSITFPALWMCPALASDVLRLDITVTDDNSINVQPASGNTATAGETIELGKCPNQEPKTKSLPLLGDIPFIQLNNSIVTESLEKMSLDELQAIIKNQNWDGDLKVRALPILEGRQLLHDIKQRALHFNGETLMDGPC